MRSATRFISESSMSCIKLSYVDQLCVVRSWYRIHTDIRYIIFAENVNVHLFTRTLSHT